jgi:glycosyltransferase involved in cell wall biosynthesis
MPRVSDVKIVAVPRDSNPYQELLYQPLRAREVVVHYAGMLTPSRTLNTALFPLELVWCRIRGYNIFHLHWTFGFRLPGAGGSTFLLRASRWWFAVLLWLVGVLGFRVVWTAHNVLPHTPVFDDDVKARRTLVDACDLVIAHTPHALEALAAIGAKPRRSEVIPLGPYTSESIRRLLPPAPSGTPTVLYFGQITPHKGVEDLLNVVAALDVAPDVIIAGRCMDPTLRKRLVAAAAALQGKVVMSLEYVPEPDLVKLLAAADAVVFPFRRVTTSSSVMLGLAAGRVAIIPDLPAFAGLPAAAVIRYPPGNRGLADALGAVATMPPETLATMGSAARSAGESVSWDEIAERTAAAMHDLLG